MAKILIVEDEEPISRLIHQNLGLAGHECVQLYDGAAAREHLRSGAQYDLILLDVMLPHVDGFTLIGDAGGMPVIFLTARDGLSDKLTGLTSGAWDYLTKPFEMLELIARVNLVLEKTKKKSSRIRIGRTVIDLDAQTAEMDGEPVSLTRQEYELLSVLVKNRNIALSREKLLELAWGFDYEGDTRTVDVHITKLRKKLGLEQQIRTVYKLGYRLEL